ncbi:MAG: hypothetical protein QNJ54_01060 [Prochloraceae cyanobacterium]|nr:hypothetical protein [Prochloraceae cyanobacterium]
MKVFYKMLVSAALSTAIIFSISNSNNKEIKTPVSPKSNPQITYLQRLILLLSTGKKIIAGRRFSPYLGNISKPTKIYCTIELHP